MDRHRVQLYVYDLSHGMMATLSPQLLGSPSVFQHRVFVLVDHAFFLASSGVRLEALWHTAVVVYGIEFFFGSAGIQTAHPVRLYSPHVRDSFLNCIS